MADQDVRQRLLSEREEANVKWDPQSLPLKAKLKLARKANEDPTYVRVLEVLMVIFTVVGALYCWFYFDNVHFHVTHAYAHLGYDVAQHQVGQRYLHGKGVEKHPDKAMEWFKKASDQGHPHAAYNLAVGHLKGYKTELRPGESHRLITHAAANGVREAHDVLNSVCTKGGCY
ncbi:secretory immunoglobulin A-binding protein EsiB [Aplysia californica]|uniref:Secretory immunoglobulin A-binding protein EsiB n=1 Tax=Aplysia californica TaxID=6500 RepID=A0ABM0JWZ3_APLCA|nr:secretory immunoglobulin A-binding protein EsiB [Aplysia californica]